MSNTLDFAAREKRRESIGATLDAIAQDNTAATAKAPPPGSEQDLALQFAARAQGRLRWTHGMDWMTNAGHIWVPDNNLQRYTIAKQVCADTAARVDKDATKMSVTKAAAANAAISLARSDKRIVTPIEQWNAGAMQLNTPGGVYDLITGAQVPRDGLLFTQATAVAPAPMSTPAWDKFLAQVFDGNAALVEFMQRLAGYCLTGSVREEKLFFLYGEGGNGKSKFTEALCGAMGDYVHNLPSDALMSQRREGHPTVYADLQGKRLALSSEIESGAYWAESRIKELTGDASITARKMRRDYFTFDATHKHVIVGNHKPRLKGDDYALARRFVLVPFTQTFEGASRDDFLADKLRAEYPGILQWAIDGAVKWHTDGLQIPDAIAAASAAYMAENDDLALWIDECCLTNPHHEASATELYQSFRDWKEANGEHAGSLKTFTQQLAKRYDRGQGRKRRHFVGITPSGSAADYAHGTRGF